MILVILGVVWVLVLLPPFLRSIREGRPSDSVGSFRRQLTVLERATPGGPVRSANPITSSTYGVPYRAGAVGRGGMARRRQAERRRQVFLTLAGTTVATTVLALVSGARLLQAVAGVCCLLLAGFTWMLLQRQARLAQARPRLTPTARLARVDDDVDAFYR